MRALVVLTSAEAKKIITKGLLSDEKFARALKEGLVALHPSSTTSFIYELITGEMPKGYWVSGVISPHGTCVSRESALYQINRAKEFSHRDYKFTWVFNKGQLVQLDLGEILERLGSDDIYVKAPNLLDKNGLTGVLASNSNGGTIGRVIKAQRKKGFTIIAPTSGEKMIYGSIFDAMRSTGANKIEFSMGSRVRVIPILQARVYTEIDALGTLTGAKAVPIAGGGLGGAEGGITIIISGERREVVKAWDICTKIKGAELPQLQLMNCNECQRGKCQFEGAGPKWRR